MWFLAGMEAGHVPEAVAVLSPRLAPPGQDAPAAPVPRVAVRWAVPPCEGEADTSGVLNGGGTA